MFRDRGYLRAILYDSAFQHRSQKSTALFVHAVSHRNVHNIYRHQEHSIELNYYLNLKFIYIDIPASYDVIYTYLSAERISTTYKPYSSLRYRYFRRHQIDQGEAILLLLLW